MDAKDKYKKYVFDYDWNTVTRAYFDKYPHKKMGFIKYNKVVDINLAEDGKLVVKRVQKATKWGMLWAYNLETLTFDFEKKVMSLETTLIKKSSLLPISGGKEQIFYKAIQEVDEATGAAVEKTEYTKSLNLQGSLSKVASKFNDSFKKGCRIVEENCEKYQNMGLWDWYKLRE